MLLFIGQPFCITEAKTKIHRPNASLGVPFHSTVSREPMIQHTLNYDISQFSSLRHFHWYNVTNHITEDNTTYDVEIIK